MDILMPKLGKNMSSGRIIKWMKVPGEYVFEGDLLYELQTDRGSTEIEAPISGILSEIVAAAGAEAAVKEKIAVLTPAEAPANTPATKAEEPAASIPVMQEKREPKASPLAKKLSEDLGISLDKLPARSRVLAQDILEYLKGQNKPQEKAQEKPKAAPVLSTDPREKVVNMSGMRKAIAKNMQSSHMTSPTVTFNLGIDMSEMKAYREKLKAEGTKVSYTDLLVKVVAKALTEYPDLNCSLVDNKIIYKNYVNMGVAVALPNGLVVPNVTDADKKSLTEVSAEIKELAEKAREGKLGPDKLMGGTFTITNLGMYGIESFSPIINQPEVAILGVNTMKDTVVAVNGEICIRPIMNLSLTADHRIVDGSLAAEFLQRVKTLMEDPSQLFA